MPIYEYVSEAPEDPGHSCRICARGFELRRPIDRAPLAACPLCILQRMLYLLLALEAVAAWLLAGPAAASVLPRRAFEQLLQQFPDET